MNFFSPTSDFIQWLKQYMKENGHSFVVELGCGEGLFTSVMRENGIKAIGIDPYRDPQHLDHSSFIPVSAKKCTIVHNTPCLLIAARPDHSGWFTNVPYYMHRYSTLMYIGVPRNIKVDMETLKYRLLDAAGLGTHVALEVKEHIGKPPNLEISDLEGLTQF